MLVLSRKPGEHIMIGDDICIELVEIQRYNKARIGITAPKEVKVHREEVWKEIKQQEYTDARNQKTDTPCTQDDHSSPDPELQAG